MAPLQVSPLTYCLENQLMPCQPISVQEAFDRTDQIATDAQAVTIVVDQLARFTGITAAKIFYRSLQLHVVSIDLLGWLRV